MIALPPAVAPLVACVLRSAAFFQFAPVLSDHVPARARLGLSLALGWMLSGARASVALTGVDLVSEVAGGAMLAAVMSMAWATVTASVGSSLTAALGEEGPAGDLARATGLASFLALSGDHWLVSVLAAPLAPGLDLGHPERLGDLGAALLSGALAAMLPLMLILMAVRWVMALTTRAATMDLTTPAAVVLAFVGVVLVAAWLPGVRALYETGLERAATVWLVGSEGAR